MINPNHDLSLTRQAELLQLSRASLYYEPVGTSQADLKLMRRIDELLRIPVDRDQAFRINVTEDSEFA